MTSTNPQWYYDAAANPFEPKHKPEWTTYSSEDNKKIEQAFQSKASKVDLQNHVLHFHERMQVHKQDFQRQRPIKREPKPQ